MPGTAARKHPVRSWIGRHERALARGWLVMVAAVLLALGFPPANRALLGGVQSGLDAWDGRWSARVEHGVGLVTGGRYEEGVAYLEALDRSFPATHVRHARDQERERILRALGHAHAQLGRKGRSLDAFRRAVLFDPLNYVNHDALARAALGFDETDEALLHFQEILALKGAHLPAVAAVVELQFADADWAAITQSYRNYLDSFLVQDLIVDLGGIGTFVPVLVDGRFHEVRLPLADSTASALRAAGGLALGPGGHGLEVRSVVLEYDLPPGRAPVPEQRVLPDARHGWFLDSTGGMETPSIFQRVTEPDPDPHPERRLRIPLTPGNAPLAAVRLDVRLTKPVDPATWNTVQMAHRNRLEHATLDSVRVRSFPGPEAQP